MDPSEVEKNCVEVANLMKTLANDKRLHILCAIWQKEMNVGDLEALVGLSQSALSQHLARLRRDGVVQTRREAQTIYYSIACEKTKAMMEAIAGVYCTNPHANTSKT